MAISFRISPIGMCFLGNLKEQAFGAGNFVIIGVTLGAEKTKTPETSINTNVFRGRLWSWRDSNPRPNK